MASSSSSSQVPSLPTKDIRFILQSILSPEEYAEIHIIEKKPRQSLPDFLCMIKLQHPPIGKNPFIHMFRDELYYTAQMLDLDPETGEKTPISSKIRAGGALEIIQKLLPTFRAVIQEALSAEK